MLEHKQAINCWYKNPAFVRDESIAVHAPSIREAITREFGSDALRVLRESQAWFRERVRLFLKEGGDPAFRARRGSLQRVRDPPRRVLAAGGCVFSLNLSSTVALS